MSLPPPSAGWLDRIHGPRSRRTVEDLLEFGAMAARLIDRGKAAYDADETLRLAAEALLHRIGEAVGRLPTDLTQAHPEVDWQAIRGTRNIVAHAYDRVDHDILWAGLERRLPAVMELLRDLVERE